MEAKPKGRRSKLRSEISEDDSEVASSTGERPRKVVRKSFSHVDVHGPAFPRSRYQGFEPPLEISSESDALRQLQAAFDANYASTVQRPVYTYFKLEDFNIYLPNQPRRAHELTTLDRLQNRRGYSELLFDGILSFGEEKRFLKGVPFRTMAIDGYGDPDVHSLRDRICIQSPSAQNANVWYQLGKPSQEYRRFYHPFLWLAQFAKHFVDYLLDTENVTLNHFRNRFSEWLWVKYQDNSSFQKWFNRCSRLRDFRTTVAAHVGFLWNECYSVDDRESGLCSRLIWGEVDPLQLKAIPKRNSFENRTIVTPFAYECFRRMYFHKHLEPRHVSSEAILCAIAERKKALRLSPYNASQVASATVHTPQSVPETATPDGSVDVRAGDVICVDPDSDSPWKTSSSIWYAYVQSIRENANNMVLDLLWLYEPSDTTLGSAYYPFQNELFLSDNCSCGKDSVNIGCVIGKADVSWFAEDPSAESGLFVRQKFRTMHDKDTYDFLSLQKSDFECDCAKKVPIYEECRLKYAIGDTVLARKYNRRRREDILEPAQVIDFDLDKQQVVLRRLRRKQKNDRNAPPNQLFLAAETFRISPSRIIRKCHVKVFDAQALNDGLPMPYDRGGAGDSYYIIGSDESTANADATGLSETDLNADEQTLGSEDVRELWPPLERGLDLSASPPFHPLKGMGIFCGGGSFDRGLEEGGAVQFKYVVDYAEEAIYSYRANVSDPQQVKFFYGSVNDYLAEAISASTDNSIATLGEVDFISAGSPCPGFSNVQPDKQSDDSLRNASMVASVVSFVDFYCPKYCILENVTSMTQGLGAGKNENVFAQILAALVALGYQVQQFHMDAWNYGSPQSRSRVFIIASAPGLKPLFHPQHTHAHPTHARFAQRALGKSTNGLPFGVRRDDYTPFQHVSPDAATNDLPAIGDSQPQLDPAFPDLRTPSEESSDSRSRIALIPIHPEGMGMVQAAQNGLLKGEPLVYYDGLGSVRKAPKSKSYSRVRRSGLFPSVMTKLHISCGVTGRTLHWNQHRTLTVQELKRAQGILDHEVIVGSPLEQVKIIGNSVDRKVAFALGLSLRESWANSKRSTGGHRLTLSQEEKENVLADPSHAFKVIRKILAARENSQSSVSHEHQDVAQLT